MPFDESPWTPQGHLTEDATTTVALGHDGPAGAQDHLQGCADCRAEVAAWTRLVGAARAAEPVEPVEPPAGTWERIAREVGVDTSVGTSVGTSDRTMTTGPVVVPIERATRRSSDRTRYRRRWLPIAAAAVIGLGAGIVGTRWSTGPSAPPAVAAQVVSAATLEPLGNAAAGPATGEAEVVEADGVRRFDLSLSGVDEPTGGFLEAWLLDADGGLVSLGAVTGGTVSVVLPPDLDLGRFDVVDVSVEPFDGDPGHSSDSVLRGVLDLPA